VAPNCAAKQETRPVRTLFPKIYSFLDPWITPLLAPSSAQIRERAFPSKDAISRSDGPHVRVDRAAHSRWFRFGSNLLNPAKSDHLLLPYRGARRPVGIKRSPVQSPDLRKKASFGP
jgi:hypothetical protein